jgi:hypothetical protein
MRMMDQFQFLGETGNENDGTASIFIGAGNKYDITITIFIWSVTGMM